jgi:hypothetical protein
MARGTGKKVKKNKSGEITMHTSSLVGDYQAIPTPLAIGSPLGLLLLLTFNRVYLKIKAKASPYRERAGIVDP